MNCAEQLIEAYERSGMLTIALDEVSLDQVMYYGVVTGQFVDEDKRVMQATDMVEKPTREYAKAYLGVKDKRGNDRFYCVFGQYVLTPRVFELLGRNISEERGRKDGKGEYELTSVLREICVNEGMTGYRVDGKRFDIGIPEAYRETLKMY